MLANNEATVSFQLGEALRTKHPGWRDGIGTEQSQVWVGIFRSRRSSLFSHFSQRSSSRTAFVARRCADPRPRAGPDLVVGAEARTPWNHRRKDRKLFHFMALRYYNALGSFVRLAFGHTRPLRSALVLRTMVHAHANGPPQPQRTTRCRRN